MLQPHLFAVGETHLERLVVCFSGALAIWLGYRLYVGMPLAAKGAGKLPLPGGARLAVPCVGPGLLFALFGAGVLAYGLLHETLEARRPGLALAHLVSAPAPASPAFAGVFEGRLTDGAETRPMRIVLWREGDLVSGAYSYGTGQGELSGIVHDDTLTLVWRSGERQGHGRVRTGPGGVEFDGTWGDGDASAGGGRWTGVRRGR
jgi:hypothetical protein